MSALIDILADRFRTALGRAFGDEHAGADPLLAVSSNQRFGDYQANVAMNLAKQLRRKPRDVARAIVDRLALKDVCDKVEIAGPGFINLRLRNGFLNDRLMELAGSEHLGVLAVDHPATVVVDYGGPNIAKQMHVGHLRSLIIGDCVARVLAWLGHRVIAQNHIGDWGLQMGMVTHAVEECGIEPDQLTLDQLEQLYRQINAAQKHDPDLRAQIVAKTRNLQNSSRDQLVAWQAARELTLDDVYKTFKRLKVLMRPEDECGESAYAHEYAPMVKRLCHDGFARQTEGALGVFPSGFTNRNGEPLPFRIVSRDGTYQYPTFDLAAIRHRVRNLNAQRIIYTHDSRQAEHFAMLFDVARQVGFATLSTRLDFAPFGTVLGNDSKPLKTREGQNVKLSDLLNEAEQRARRIIDQKTPDLPPDQRAAIAAVVGIGAVKYADLANDRVRDYIFDWDRMLAFEGNTAPYLQNAYVRSRSIFRKGNVKVADLDAFNIVIDDPAERVLALRLLQFPSVVIVVSETLEPHRLCTFLYELATAFHQFYERCHVLNAEDPDTRHSRLRLCEVTANILRTGLDLLGIEVAERM